MSVQSVSSMTNITPRPTALVVEDDNLIRMDIVDMFTDAGFEVIEAWSGIMAVRLLEQQPAIALVFSDVQMPGPIDGIALARVLARRWPTTVIMLCSGIVTPRADDLPSGARFFSKPVSGRAISAAAHALIAA